MQLRKCQLEEDAETESFVKTIPGVCQRGLTGLTKDGMGSYWRCVGVAGEAILPTACNAGSKRPAKLASKTGLLVRETAAGEQVTEPTHEPAPHARLFPATGSSAADPCWAARAAQLSGNPIVGQ